MDTDVSHEVEKRLSRLEEATGIGAPDGEEEGEASEVETGDENEETGEEVE